MSTLLSRVSSSQRQIFLVAAAQKCTFHSQHVLLHGYGRSVNGPRHASSFRVRSAMVDPRSHLVVKRSGNGGVHWIPIIRMGYSTRASQTCECWKCGHKWQLIEEGQAEEKDNSNENASLAARVLCPRCNTIRRDSANDQTMSHYTVMGIGKELFSIDKDRLEKHFKILQKLLHPDRFATRSEAELKLSELWSSRVNQAYGMLRDPRKRARYVLERNNVTLEACDVPKEFLMEMMTLQENIEDGNIPPEDLKQIFDELGDQLAVLFEKFGQVVDAENDFQKAREHLTQINYLARIRDRVDEMLEVR